MKIRTKEPAIRSKHIVALVTASLVLAANAAPVAPTAWKQSSAFSAAREAAKLSLAAGMDGTETYLYNQYAPLSTGETTGADGKEWVTRSESLTQTVFDQRRVWIVADLGAVYDLSTIKIWNFQWQNAALPGGDLSTRGISQFDVYVRNSAADTDDGTAGGTAINTGTVGAIQMSAAPVFNLGTANPWQLALTDQQIARAPNADDYVGQSYSLTGTGRFVALVADGWYTGAGAGLGKVRFEGTLVPEPSAAILLGLGGLGLILRRRRS